MSDGLFDFDEGFAVAPLGGVPSPIDRELLFAHDGALRRELPAADGGGAVFSARQAAAIERRGETLVSAGAGAGKTSVLVERYLRLLEGDDTLDTGSILAITFTDKAAAEMRERVRHRLEALLGGRTDLPERWRLEDSWIGTFHGLAQRLLRRYALAAGLDPDAQVADESRANELRDEAFELALRRWLVDPDRARGGALAAASADELPADGEAALELAASFGIDALRADTIGLLGLRRTQGHDPADGDGPALPLPPADEERVRATVRALRESARAAVHEAEETFAAGKPSEAGQRALDLVVAAATAIAEQTGPPDEPLLPPSATIGAWAMPTRAPKVGKGPAVGALRDAIAAATETALAVEMAPLGARELRLREALLVATARGYRRLKRERAVLDFDDLLLALLDLLRRRPDIGERLRRRFRQVLVDEYQDTNPVQLEVVSLLSSPEGRFQVGDRLQAIYGFRHATVAGFDSAARRASEGGGRLELDETFRCPSDVLAVANRIGAASHEGYQPLVGGHGRTPADEREGPAVEIHVLAKGPVAAGRPTEDESDEAEEGADATEAEHVAQLVAEMVAAGRPAREIALLLRRKAPVASLERALLERGIDAVPVVAAPLLETLEGRELEAWLRAVANPRDDVALLGALRLPTAGVDADALVPLAAEHRFEIERAREQRQPDPALWETLQRLGDPGHRPSFPMPESALEDLELQTAALLRHRGLARRLGPAALLADLRANDGYRASILARPGGPRRWALVEAMVEWAEAQEEAGDDLDGLLRRIVADRGGPDAPVLTDGDAVRITTIHRSKGLEWPVVICCDLGAKVTARRPGILVDPDPAGQRVGLRLRVGGGKVDLWDYPALHREAGRAQAEEERRLLHVAMTRAKERLILSGTWPVEVTGSGAEKAPTGLLNPKTAVPVEPGTGHDEKPTTPPLHWLLPLVSPYERWPRVGEETEVEVTDPTGATGRPAPVRIIVRDPTLVIAPEVVPEASRADAPAPSVSAAGDGGRDHDPFDDEDGRPPESPLVSPVSYSGLARRLGLELDEADVVRERIAAERDGTPEETAPSPLVGAEDATRRLAGRDRGTVVHGLLERRLAGRVPAAAAGTGITAADVEAVLADELPDPPAVDAEVAAMIGEVVRRLERSEVARRALAAPADRRHLERPFLFDPGEGRPLLQGVIDLWIDEPDGRVVIADWKTNRLDGRTAAELVERAYGLQRDVYALAALLGGAREVEVVFVVADAAEEPVAYRFTEADRERLRATVLGAIDQAARMVPRR